MALNCNLFLPHSEFNLHNQVNSINNIAYLSYFPQAGKIQHVRSSNLVIVVSGDTFLLLVHILSSKKTVPELHT